MNREYVDFTMHDCGFSTICNGEELLRASGAPAALSSAVWAVANQAVYTPIMVTEITARILNLGIYNGAAVAGNVDLGLYLPDAEGKPGARLGSTGATAQAGTSRWQVIGLSGGAKLAHKGLLYVACSFNGIVAAVTQFQVLNTAGLGPFQLSVFTEAAAHPLPANATPSSAFVVATLPLLMALCG